MNQLIKDSGFTFAVAELEHPHIFDMARELVEAGARLKCFHERDGAKAAAFQKMFPQAEAAPSVEAILRDNEIRLVAAAGVPSERAELGVRVMEHGKDYFVDKTAFTDLKQLEAVKKSVAKTGRKFIVYLSGQFTKSVKRAKQIIDGGEIGRVVNVISLGPHRLNEPSRPAWFFDKKRYGGILCDIGSHQIAEFLYFADAGDARVISSRVGNYANPRRPELEDFGDASLVADNGATSYFKVDWLTPDGLRAWGDDRTIITGTKGFIEIRKNLDLGVDSEPAPGKIFVVNGEREYVCDAGDGEYPERLEELLLDFINGTENAISQDFIFKVGELCIIAQEIAVTCS